MDWTTLLGVALREWRMLPRDFWALTPAELGLMLGLDQMPPRMGRERLQDLIRDFPDERTQDGR